MRARVGRRARCFRGTPQRCSRARAIGVLAASAAALAIVSSALAAAGPTPDPAPPVTTIPAPTTKPSVEPVQFDIVQLHSLRPATTSSGPSRRRPARRRRLAPDRALALGDQLSSSRPAPRPPRPPLPLPTSARSRRRKRGQREAGTGARRRAPTSDGAREGSAKESAERARKAREAALSSSRRAGQRDDRRGAKPAPADRSHWPAKLMLGLAALLVLLSLRAHREPHTHSGRG